MEFFLLKTLSIWAIEGISFRGSFVEDIPQNLQGGRDRFMHEYMDAKGCYKMKQLIESGAFEGLMVISNTQE